MAFAVACAPDSLEEAAVASGVTSEQLRDAADHPGSWVMYGGTYAEDRFSPLAEIDRTTVSELGLLWTHDLGLRGGHETTPLVVDGVMIATGPWSVLYAIDVQDGKRLWTYDPGVPRLHGLKACCDVVNRGAALYEGNVIVGTLDGRLVAVDATTGVEVWETLTVDPESPYTITGAPRVVEGLVLIGNGGAEFGVRGYVTAYDARTGEQVWRTYTVPGNPADGFESAAMERAAETWTGEWWTVGGGGTAWDAMAYDPELELLYIGTGNGSPWSRLQRSPGGGDNLYLSSIIALRPSDGELVWHYQTTPGDHWDYTATQPLVLADLEIEGQLRHTIMQAPKNGIFYVIDRETGEFISGAPYVDVTWMTGFDESGRPVENPDAVWSNETAEVKPSFLGAHSWQPMAFNPATGLMYLPANDVSALFRQEMDWEYDPAGYNIGAAIGLADWSAPGFLLAWDPVAQEEAWRVPLAHWWNGGVLTTAGGLVFQGGADGRFAAYDAVTGALLWDVSTGQGIIAPPVTYQVDGTQYVSVVAGWGGVMHQAASPAGDAARYEQRGRVFTFALGGDAEMPSWAPKNTTPVVPVADLPTDEASITAGEALFESTCAQCHGTAGASLGSYPNLQASSQAVHDRFQDIVRGGILEPLGMPGFGSMFTEEEVTLMQAYIVDAAKRAVDGG